MGIPFLTKSLNTILVQHIKKNLPRLNSQIKTKLADKEAELESYLGTEYTQDTLHGVDSGPLVLALINRFVRAYGDKLAGRFIENAAVEMQGGSRINYIFHELFRKAINKIDPFEYLSDQDIQTAIKNASAVKPSMFVPEQAFEVLVRQQIARLLEPSLDCTYQVYEELRRVVIEIDVPALSHYYKLHSRMCDVMEGVLDKCLTPTQDMVMNLMEIENANINTNHPDFMGGGDSVLNLFEPVTDDSAGVTDESGQLVDRHFSLFGNNSNQKGQQDLNDFQDIQDENEVPVQQPTQPPAQMKKEPSIMQSAQNQDLKASMHYDVFGYDTMEPQTPALIMPYSDGQEINPTQTPGVPMIEPASNLPSVILDSVPMTMRVEKDQESARMLMKTRIIQNLIFSYFNIVKKNISDLVPKTIMAFLINESRKIA